MNSPSMNMYKKRERTQNWNHQEKKYLLDLCRKDMRIIENKRLDAGLTAVKNKAWKIIHQKFSNQFGTDRTCNRLKEQWRRMKGKSKDSTSTESLTNPSISLSLSLQPAHATRYSTITIDWPDSVQRLLIARSHHLLPLRSGILCRRPRRHANRRHSMALIIPRYPWHSRRISSIAMTSNSMQMSMKWTSKL